MLYPVAVMGCRTSEMSLECCEYDLAVFVPPEENKKNQSSQVLQVSNCPVEFVYIHGPIKDHIIDLADMIILKDNSRLMLSSTKDIIAEKYKKMLAASGKKLLIDSLIAQQEMMRVKHPIVAAMWLKIAAYELIDGMLSLSGKRPMPLHILDQVRQIDSRATEGIEVALECIGTERATRPSISRSIEAIKELKSRDYDRELFMSKINHLLLRGRLADCYYYAGRAAVRNLISRKENFHIRYSKLLQLALDLLSDLQSLERMQKQLFRAANFALRR